VIFLFNDLLKEWLLVCLQRIKLEDQLLLLL